MADQNSFPGVEFLSRETAEFRSYRGKILVRYRTWKGFLFAQTFPATPQGSDLAKAQFDAYVNHMRREINRARTQTAQDAWISRNAR